MSAVPPRDPDRPVSGWALGGVTFAASMLGLVGIFQIIAGLAAIIDDDFYVVAQNYTFDIDTSAWGWIHLLIGLIMLGVCVGLIRGQMWAGMTAIFLASLSAVANFFFIPYYPFWSILLIALDVWVIWSLTRPGAIET
jgi:predicted Na+-dependent transporter